ncbi:glycosyltransferase family 4 protein [Pyrococcus kukulkanii]|uniref:glycosyltransferase family 4 protein n=1 Tax=Pyrococcus kukulkanii TaxID=1609559 RepID=UPI00356AA0FD
MKILLLTPYFYPHGGGLENYAYNIAKRLIKKGHEVTVLCSTKSGNSITEQIEGIEVHRIKPTMIFSNTPIVASLFRELDKLLKNNDFDVINAHMPVTYFSDIGAVYKKLTNLDIPFVVTYHNDLVKPDLLDNIAKVYNATMLQIVLESADYIITPSPYCYFESPFLRKIKWKVSWIPPGVEIFKFEKKRYTNMREVYNLPHDSKIILFVGAMSRYHAHKGVNILIKAFSDVIKEIKNAYLMLVGKGDMIPTYKALTKSLGIDKHVIFTGFIEDDKLPDYYRSSDVVVLPSTTVAEGFGMVLIEGNSAKKPVIASNIGGMKYVVKHKKTGLLVPPKDSKSLADAIIHLLQNEKEAKKMGRNGRKLVKKYYTWERVAKMTENVYKEVVS